MAARATFLAALLIACSGDTTDKTDTTDATDATDATDTVPTATTATTGDTGVEQKKKTKQAQTATADNDTIDKPSFYQSFLGSGAADTFTTSGDISALPGDPEDWVGFTTPAPQNPDVNVTFELLCTGTDTIAMQIWDNDGASPTDLGASYRLNCAVGKSSYLLDTSHDYAARIYYPSGSTAGDYTAWELTVSW